GQYQSKTIALSTQTEIMIKLKWNYFSAERGANCAISLSYLSHSQRRTGLKEAISNDRLILFGYLNARTI
ncbi:MAG: hypothetical protein AAGD05_10880, partial [Bacteroidota bacterium]